jgi:hypothetical protein
VLGHAAGGGHHHLEDVGDLRRREDGQVAPVDAGHHRDAAGLHGLGDQALLDVALVHDVGRLGEGSLHRIGVGRQRPRVAPVRAQTVVDDDAVAGRVLEVGRGLQRVVVDHDGVDGIGHLVAALRHDDGHDVAHVARLADGDRPVVGRLHVAGHRPRARHGGRPVVAQVLAGEHVAHAGHRQRRTGVDVADAGVGERAADHAHPQRPWDVQVVDVLRLASEQAGVLLAEQPCAHSPAGLLLADVGRGHAGTSSDLGRSPAAASTDRTMLW